MKKFTYSPRNPKKRSEIENPKRWPRWNAVGTAGSLDDVKKCLGEGGGWENKARRRLFGRTGAEWPSQVERTAWSHSVWSNKKGKTSLSFCNFLFAPNVCSPHTFRPIPTHTHTHTRVSISSFYLKIISNVAFPVACSTCLQLALFVTRVENWKIVTRAHPLSSPFFRGIQPKIHNSGRNVIAAVDFFLLLVRVLSDIIRGWSD